MLMSAGTALSRFITQTLRPKPQTLDSRKLAAPELIHNEGDDKSLFANERLLKQMPVFSSQVLNEYDLVLVHDRRAHKRLAAALRAR